MLCVFSLEKYMALFFLEIAGEKRKTYPPITGWKVRVAFRVRLFSVFGDAPLKPKPACSDWLVAGPHGAWRDPDRGSLGQRSVAWRGAHTLGNFLNGRKEQLSSKLRLFHIAIFWHTFSWKSPVILMRILLNNLTQNSFAGCYEEKHHVEVSMFSVD